MRYYKRWYPKKLCRILRQTLHAGSEPALTVAQVEDIARRVMRETA